VLDGYLVSTFILYYYTQRDGKHQITRNYHYLLRSNPEDCIYRLLRGGSLKSRKAHLASEAFFRAFTKLRKAATSFLKPVHLHGSIRLTLDGF
jgi:hypothetical protein